MTFPLSLSWAAWLLSDGGSVRGIPEEDAVPDQFIPALIDREPTGQARSTRCSSTRMRGARCTGSTRHPE
jgi:hypothetical protein